MTALRPAHRRFGALAVAGILAAAAVVQLTTGSADAAPITRITPNAAVNDFNGDTRVVIETTTSFRNADTVVSFTRVDNVTNQPTGETVDGTVVFADADAGVIRNRFDVDANFFNRNPGSYNVRFSSIVNDELNAEFGTGTAPAPDTCTRCFTVLTPGAPVVNTFNSPRLSANTTVGPVTITGTNFANASAVEFLLGGAVDPKVRFTRTSASTTQITGNVTVDNGAQPGFRDIRVRNTDGLTGTCVNCAQVSGIIVNAVSPNAGTNTEVRRLTITGLGFPADARAELVREFQTGQANIAGGNTAVLQPDRIDADFNLNGAQPGTYLIRVSSADGQSNNVACSPRFTVAAPGTPAPTPSASQSPTSAGTCRSNNPSGAPTPTGTVSPTPSISPTPTASVTASSSASPSASPTPPAGTGRYVAVNPDRTLDTRAGVGSIAAPLGPRETRSFQVTGKSGIPASATAVTFNLTVAQPSAAGFVTAFPAGQQRPTASNINFVRGEAIANLVTVPIGSGGQVSLYNASGTTDVIADVVGYYGPASGGAAYSALNPERILDSRDGNGTTADPFGPGETRQLQITGRANVPATATAVAFNLTAISPTAAGFLTAYPAGTIRPTASNLNFVKGDVIANLVVVRVGTGGQVSIFNNSGATDVAADIVGYFSDSGGAAALFTPLTPERFLDTRDGTGGLRQRIGPSESRSLQITGRGGIPDNATAVTFNLTAVSPSSSGFFTAYPSGTIRPTASNVNFVRGDVIANLVIVRIGSGGRVDIFNNSGFADAVADVVGYYVAPPAPSASASASGTASPTSSTSATATPTATVSTTATPAATASPTVTATATASTTATATPTTTVTPTTTAVAAASSTDAPTGMLLGLGLFVLFGATSSAAAAAYAGRGYTRRH